jgi:hypothetical protein
MQEDEEILHGGNVNQIVRIRNTVHRTTNWNPLVKVLHTVLEYLIFYLKLPIQLLLLYFLSGCVSGSGLGGISLAGLGSGCMISGFLVISGKSILAAKACFITYHLQKLLMIGLSGKGSKYAYQYDYFLSVTLISYK